MQEEREERKDACRKRVKIERIRKREKGCYFGLEESKDECREEKRMISGKRKAACRKTDRMNAGRQTG
jgi:hypothetical protein